MSKRNKLQKFAELLVMPNVYESYDNANPQLQGMNGEPVDLKGKWCAEHFKNDHTLTLELACGRGEYTLQLSEKYPERNFLGVDIKGARIWKGATIAREKELDNAAFLRTRIERIDYFFTEAEADEIWITFPDPFLRESKANRRLTSPNFRKLYKKILKKDGVVHLKTDSPELYAYTMETLSEDPTINIQYTDDDIYAKELPLPELDFKTYYEFMHLADNRKIKYVRFNFKD